MTVELMTEPMTGIEPAYSAWEVDSARSRVFLRVQKLRFNCADTSKLIQGRPLNRSGLVTPS
jgi:hypothetical protein